MFIGRDKELTSLNKFYVEDSFQFVVMYGRRRIGKTELLKKFSENKNVIFYSAVESRNNLSDFSEVVFNHFGEKAEMRFSSWKDSFSYIGDHTVDRLVLIIDEFPYIAKAEPEIKSVLQHQIDHQLKDKNMMLILCGSSVSFMINEVMGEKSPLYARMTSVMEILPFDYTMTGKFLPGYSKENQMMVYSITGGVPFYLSKFTDKKTLEENISDVIIDSGSILSEEPMNLLKSELREPITYNTILSTIASGAVKLSEIADKSGIEVTKLPAYLKNLTEMRLIDKIICCGEKENSRKSQYRITDNFFSFWYRFVFGHATEIELMEPLDYVNSIMEEVRNYAGFKFEGICLQYIKNAARRKELPFIPKELGKWWGANPLTKTPDDIDILGINGDKYLFCECKFKNESFDLKEFTSLLQVPQIFRNAAECYFYVFIKSRFTDAVKKEAGNHQVKLITIEEM